MKKAKNFIDMCKSTCVKDKRKYINTLVVIFFSLEGMIDYFYFCMYVFYVLTEIFILESAKSLI